MLEDFCRSWDLDFLFCSFCFCFCFCFRFVIKNIILVHGDIWLYLFSVLCPHYNFDWLWSFCSVIKNLFLVINVIQKNELGESYLIGDINIRHSTPFHYLSWLLCYVTTLYLFVYEGQFKQGRLLDIVLLFLWFSVWKISFRQWNCQGNEIFSAFVLRIFR